MVHAHDLQLQHAIMGRSGGKGLKTVCNVPCTHQVWVGSLPVQGGLAARGIA